MKRILRSRLPQRLRGTLPPLVVEIAIGLAIPIAVVLARLAIVPIAGDRAPYAFVFAGVVFAGVLAGWRSGLIALIAGQALTWFLLVEPMWGFASPQHWRLGGFVIATLSELLILIVIALYQREVDKNSSEREQRMDLLGEALKEIDHRTRNNYQTVLALVQLQAQRSNDPGVKTALQQVGDRIQAVTLATERLALRSDDLETVRLGEHLYELCAQVERGLSRDGVRVKCEVDDLSASSDKAICLSIIVNELVTNALKHAFKEADEGSIHVRSAMEAGGIAILVEDNGCGMTASRSNGGSGLGTRLVERFVRQLGGKHIVSSSGQGTQHKVWVPSLD